RATSKHWEETQPGPTLAAYHGRQVVPNGALNHAQAAAVLDHSRALPDLCGGIVSGRLGHLLRVWGEGQIGAFNCLTPSTLSPPPDPLSPAPDTAQTRRTQQPTLSLVFSLPTSPLAFS